MDFVFREISDCMQAFLHHVGDNPTVELQDYTLRVIIQPPFKGLQDDSIVDTSILAQLTTQLNAVL